MQLAFGPLELTPEQFWEYTPAEIHRLAEGYNWRYQSKRTLIAWQTAMLINIQLPQDERLTVDEILNPEQTTVEEAFGLDDDDEDAKLAKLKEMLNEIKERKQAEA